jgi:uncharacterized protein YjiS (DUF1127 family)
MATVTATQHSNFGAILYRVARAVNAVLTAFSHRRTLRELASLDDHQLADIGLRRDQLTPSLFASQRHNTR